MQLKKERNTKTYAVKKQHQKEDKRLKLQKMERKQNQEMLEGMSAEDLLAFLEEKYEKLERENVNMNKVKYLVVNQIRNIVQKFYEKYQKEKAEFFTKSECGNISAQKHFQELRKDEHYIARGVRMFSSFSELGIKIVTFSIYHHTTRKNSLVLKSIYGRPCESLVEPIDMRRWKNDAILALKTFLDHKEKVEKLLD